MNEQQMGSATYSPEDNKLRFYPDARLSKEDYGKIKAAGFSWAPKQELFVAPMWTPGREDLLIAWCGEVGDEDKSLVDRAEERAERFEDYSDRRADDAEQAHGAVEAIAGNIPLGQPILVGHHSEKRARKDAERIENGMRRAVKMWEQSKYWTDRAASAIGHAKYLERPDVRARRIKKIEADKRRQERSKADAEQALRFWRGEINLVNQETGEKSKLEISEANRENIHKLLGGVLGNTCGQFNVIQKEGAASWEGWDAWHVLEPDETRYKECPPCTVEQCREAAERVFTRSIEHYDRWLAHYENRLAYERAMLAADGGTATDRKGPEKGGGCRCWASPGRFDGGWSYIQKVNKVSVTVLDNWGNGGGDFTRNIPFDKLTAVMTAAEVQEARDNGTLLESANKTGYFVRSAPKPEAEKLVPEIAAVRAAARAQHIVEMDAIRAAHGASSINYDTGEMTFEQPEPKASSGSKFEAMRETLKNGGVQVVTASNLFPTPTALAERVADLADLTAGDTVLEPSAGTGQLIKAAISRGIFRSDITAVEINGKLAELLAAQSVSVVCGDFLEHNPGTFDKILMNPPFDNGADIQHIQHALTKLNEGGRLVAICANGSRQREAFEGVATSWIDLEPGTFKESGTNVNAAIVVIDK